MRVVINKSRWPLRERTQDIIINQAKILLDLVTDIGYIDQCAYSSNFSNNSGKVR